jgi:hypothetical protein
VGCAVLNRIVQFLPVTDGRFVRTKTAAQRQILTGTLDAECRGERFDCRANQSCQSFQTLGRFRLPGRDEIAAGSELAKRLSLSFSIWFHLFFRLLEILQIRSVANVLSAGHTDLPKQKPNKNKPNQDFFFAFGFLF